MTDPASPVEIEFSRFVDCGKLTSGGRSYAIEADSQEREALEKRLAINSLEYLTAEFFVAPGKGGQIVLTGQLKARVTQTCVVSLKPVISDIDISIERVFSESAKHYWGQEKEPDEDGNFSGSGQEADLAEPPEPMENGGVDLGEVASEELAIELDPFPRLPGIELADSIGIRGTHQPEETKNPFAVLEKLKKKLE